MLSTVLLIATLALFSAQAQRPPHLRPLTLEGCGITKGCYAIPFGCHEGPRGHADCDGVYVQEIDRSNMNNIHVQIFARNVAGWVAIGFNTEPHMVRI